jgi:hypothetical protein
MSSLLFQIVLCTDPRYIEGSQTAKEEQHEPITTEGIPYKIAHLVLYSRSRIIAIKMGQIEARQ